MDSYEIIIPKNAPEKDFLYDSILNLEECEAQDFSYLHHNKILIKINPDYHDKLLDIIADAITIFYKFRLLNNGLWNNKFSIFDNYAFLGALLSVDKESEINEVKKATKLLVSIAPHSLYEFRLNRLKKNWQSLLELSKTLVKDVVSTTELYEIISYFVSSSLSCPKVTITDTTPLKLWINDNLITPIPITDDNNINLLITAMREHPSHIIIKNQELLNDDLLNTFRALGQ